jgi:F-type H+-transporting ATPase subunit a
MTHLLAAGDPFEHTWNSWHLHLYFWDLDLRAIPGFEALGISNFVVMMLSAALLLLFIGSRVGRESKRAVEGGRMPRGFAHVMEVLVQYVRDDMMKPAMPHHYKDGFLISVFCTYFFFILFCNLLGLLPQPFGFTATGSPWVTGSLAFLGTLVLMFYFGIKEHGLPGFLAHLAPPAPAWIRWPLLFPVEFMGLFVKPFALMIRLAANMTAGHIILAVLMGFLTTALSAVVAVLVYPASAAGFLAITVFEIVIAFIQAYIFTMLSAVFVGQLVAHEH